MNNTLLWAPLKTTAPALPNGITAVVQPFDDTGTVVFSGALLLKKPAKGR